MLEIRFKEFQTAVRFFGRTFADEEHDAVFFNWTGAGFTLQFEGTRLDVALVAYETVFLPEGIHWPWISVFVDDNDKPINEFCISQPSGTYTLFQSETCGQHTIRVVKRSENDKGKLGLTAIGGVGRLLPMEYPSEPCRLEFVGDSITCGFGNAAQGRDDPFCAECEDGQHSFAALTAKLLHAQYHSICVSGISLCMPLDPDFRLRLPEDPDVILPVRAMEDYYTYTDRPYEERLGKKGGFQEWAFSNFRPDAIVLNLGTNDSFRIKAAADKRREEAHFEASYKAFLASIRKHNGIKPVIACTLGPMDYYLYDNILRTTERYQKETGDEQVFCFKFGGIFPWREGYGGGDHPSLATHQRMAEELAGELKRWLK